MNKGERLLMQLQREADTRFQRERDSSQLESKSDAFRRKLRNLQAKTKTIEGELDLRHRVELESQRHLKATMALREANLTTAEKKARADEIHRGQVLYSNLVMEAHPDWRLQENSNLAFYRQQIAPGSKRRF
jgi:hypothetical protein